MITSVKIKDNTKTPFEYVSNIEAFENGREFIFKPGVNVIIGKNGVSCVCIQESHLL
jgi:predicted ATPase